MSEAFLEPKASQNGIIPKILCGKQTFAGHDQCCKAHYHSYIELIYCLDGEFSAWLNNDNYKFRTGDLLVINSNEVHAIQSTSDDTGAYIVLRFEPEILYDSSRDVFEIKYVFPFTVNDATPQKVFKYSEIYDTDIPSLMHDILKEYTEQQNGYELAVRSDICRIFVWILRYWDSSGVSFPAAGALNSEYIKIMQNVLDYIAAHYSNDISAESMAKLANMSYSYFSRIFRKVMNKSFNDYLNFVRTTEAEKLLTSTDMSITEIAYASGFSSSSYFIKIFSKYKCMSPSRFRKRFLNEFSERGAKKTV